MRRLRRLAWFSPLPPTRSGIAQYSREVLPLIAHEFAIDVFVDGDPQASAPPAEGIRVCSAHDFVWMHQRQPYDLTIYQLGNAPCHDYMWAYLVRYPGMVVLHDGQVHHARARMLLQRSRKADYRREFSFNHPDADIDLAELGAEGLLGSLTYLWPMRRLTIEASRLIAVHNEFLASEIRDEHSRTPIAVVPMGVPPHAPAADARARVRARHGIPPDAVLFTAFGRVTPEKRVREAIQALPSVVAASPGVRILLAGEAVEYYDMLREAEAQGVGSHVVAAGYVPDNAIDDYLEAADVCLCMRWPTSRETSASWLRCLAAGRPTVVSDLAHLVDICTLDMRSGAALSPGDPVGASIDLMDEKHSLAMTIRKLAEDQGLRGMMGANARQLWEKRFQLAAMADAYRSLIATALNAPFPDPHWRETLPPHLTTDGTEWASKLVRESARSDAGPGAFWTHPSD